MEFGLFSADRLLSTIPKFRCSKALNRKPNPTNHNPTSPNPNSNPNLRNSGTVPIDLPVLARTVVRWVASDSGRKGSNAASFGSPVVIEESHRIIFTGWRRRFLLGRVAALATCGLLL